MDWQPTRWFTGIWLRYGFGLVVWLGLTLAAAGEDTLLTNAIDVISLPAEKAAQYIKVSVIGVVTAADPVLNGRFFLQDHTGGVFVDNVNGLRVKPGQVVTVSGITYPGAYAPTITGPKVKVVGTSPLPSARLVTVEQLMSGAEDSQRIEIAAVVRDARVDGNRLAIDLSTGGYRFRAYANVSAGYEPEPLVGAQVRIRGTAAEAHNRTLRQLIQVEVYLPAMTDLVVEKPEPMNPFARPVMPLNNLAQYRPDNSLAERVHVRGVVTFQKTGESLFLQDEHGALQIQSRLASGWQPGDTVEAVGFPSIENYLPMLQDAVFHKATTELPPVQPKAITMDELQSGLHHAEWVTLRGRLIERTVHPGRAARLEGEDTTTRLVLQGSNYTFTAEAYFGQTAAEREAIPLDSLVEVSGVCVTEINSEGKLKSFQLLLRQPGDLKVLQRPDWLTPRRLLIGLLICLTILLVIGGWSVMLSRKNAALNFLIKEREAAQRALQEAHDQLEERVKERTEQLKFEITARKESEVQFKAVLGERTRLAQELHDTVEQTLTGIALQLDAAAKLHQRQPDHSRHHMELARSLMAKSQDEMRQSIWDLRSRELEQFDLARALAAGASQVLCSTDTQIDFATEGEPRSLPEVVEENLLRIGQETFANILKHAEARRVEIRLTYEARQVVLEVQDDGRGFERDKVAGPQEGHFGLLGMSERARRLAGRLVVASQPKAGTRVRVEIPLQSAPDFNPMPAAGQKTLP